MAFKQSKNPFGRSPLNFNSPLNSFDSLVGKLMNEGKSKEAATKIAGKVANAKMKGAGSGPTAAQKARAKGSPAKQAKPDFLDLDKDGNTSEPMKEAAKGSPAKMHDADKVKKLKSEIDILRNDPEKAVKMGLSTEGQGGVDYEAISQREAQVKAEQAKHDRKKGDKESPAKMKSPIEKELVGKQKNLPEGLKKAIEAAPESPAKMAKPTEPKKKMSKKLRCRKGYVPKDPGNPEAGCRKMTRLEISKQAADQLNAKDPVKGSPAKSVGKRSDHDMSEAYWEAHKKTEHGRKAHKDMPVDKKRVAQEKSRKKPEKVVQKTESREKADEFVAQRKKPSPANLTALINTGVKIYKAIKGSKKVKKAAKSAKAFQNPGKQYQAKINKAPKPKVKTVEVKRPILDPASTAVGGAAGYAASKKKSPINNAYENPEFFTPTKSSYGQDMDNFFSSVEQGYQDAINPELQEQKARMREGRLQNRQDRIDRRIDKNVEKGNFDKASKLADRRGKVGDKITRAGEEAKRFGGIVDELNRNKGFDLTSLSKDQIDFIKNNL